MLEDCDFSSWKEHICIEGGIWDMDNTNQSPNPYHFPNKDGITTKDRLAKLGLEFPSPKLTEFTPFYNGHIMRICRVKNLVIKNLTLKNPVCYGIQIGYVENFTIKSLFFDYFTGAPKLWNMDGVHVEGNCKNGTISDLKGACHDDMVALTADDGLYGTIDNIVIDGIFAEHSHSAVRLLSHGLPVRNISIRNIFGSYYVYCIGLTKYHGGEDERGVMKNITIENVFACACDGTADVGGGNYDFIWVQKGLDVENLKIDTVFRDETTFATSTIKIDNDATVNGFTINNIVTNNATGKELRPIVIEGKVQ